MAREQRRLAAIIAADVVGYSRLMGRDESGTLARLREHRKQRFEPILNRFGGRIVKLTGDGALVEFASAVEALAAAITFQQAAAGANRGQPPDSAIVFRIGLHLGDVIVEDDDLYGDGVNIAARLEGEAPPGGIVVSGDVHNAVAGRLKATFGDLGELSLKNIERPVRAFGVAWHAVDWASERDDPVEGAATVVRTTSDLSLPDKPSIAVLPFQNMSGDPEQEYFVDGLVEDIITELSRLPSLFVIARNSSFTYKGRAVDIRQVASELGVGYVMEGSVRRAGTRVRITGQLIDASTGGHIWADRFDGELDDVFELQDRVTESVIHAILPKLQKAEIERSRRKRPDSLRAYDLYLRSLPHLYEFTPQTNDAAMALLRQAVAMASNYASALASLAWSLEQRLVHNWPGAGPQDTVQIVELTRRAIAADRDDADATGLAGFLLVIVGREHCAGLQAVQRALEVNPNSAMVCWSAGWVHAFCGQPTVTVELGKRLHRLSPSDLHTHFILNTLGVGYLLLKRFEDAADVAARSARHQVDFDVTYWILAPALGHLGRTDAAAQAVSKLVALDPSATVSELSRRLPFDEAGLAIVLDGLRKAGLPE